MAEKLSTSRATGAADERGGRRRSNTFFVRKAHRWMGLVIGIQFAVWTISGIYFAWTRLENIHGDPLRAEAPRIPTDVSLASPQIALERIGGTEPVDSIVSLELVRVLGAPTWRIGYLTVENGVAERRTHLADAATGEPLPPLSREQAVAVAEEDAAFSAPVARVELLERGDIGPHHEFRGGPTPVWVVHWDHRSGARSYVPAEHGTVRTVRNTQWRIFDFFWMLHTMDYRTRDDFNNWLLRIMSVLAVVTIIAGFVLFVLTSRPYRRWLGRRRDAA